MIWKTVQIVLRIVWIEIKNWIELKLALTHTGSERVGSLPAEAADVLLAAEGVAVDLDRKVWLSEACLVVVLEVLRRLRRASGSEVCHVYDSAAALQS